MNGHVVMFKGENFEQAYSRMVSKLKPFFEKKTCGESVKRPTKKRGEAQEQYEDRLENYWIASDKGIKKLAESITKKLSRIKREG